MWIVQTVLGAVLSGGIAWTTWATVTANRHETKIAVVETKVNNVDKSLDEIKGEQKDFRNETNKKLDRLLERAGRGR